jgi:hypothetical protein
MRLAIGSPQSRIIKLPEGLTRFLPLVVLDNSLEKLIEPIAIIV